MTPLISAVTNKHKKMVEELLEVEGIDVNLSKNN